MQIKKEFFVKNNIKDMKILYEVELNIEKF